MICLYDSNHLDEKIETLQNQVNSLQDRIRVLQTTLENSKYALSATREASNQAKSSQQDDYKTNFQENDDEVIDSIYPTIKSVSEVSKSPLKTLSHSEEYNLSSNQNKAPNRSNFITLGNIPEEEKIEIIKSGFQLQAEGKISLKKYYESTDQYSLFQLKEYQIKYETIRRTKLYQQLKDK